MAGRPSQSVTLRGKCWAASTAAEAIITSSTLAMCMPPCFAFFVHPSLQQCIGGCLPLAHNMGRWLIYLVLALFVTPGKWQRFIPFQSKGKLQPRNRLFQSNTAFIVLTLFLTLKIFRPTVFSQSMSSTKLKWLFCVPHFCWAQMAICPMRYVAVLLYSRAA
jgi:hypothetical protein